MFFENKFLNDSLESDSYDPNGSVSSDSTMPSPMFYSMLSSNSNESPSFSPFSPNEERRRPRKKPLHESEKSKFVVNSKSIKAGKDTRTTIMIKNIPNKYT